MKTKMQTRKFSLADAAKRLFLIVSLLTVLTLVASACSSSSSGDDAKSQSVFITADDGLVLRGKFYGRAAGVPTVMLVHDYNKSQGVWSALVGSLTARGYSVLTFDLRGHGDSPGQKEPGLTDADVAASYQFILKSLSSNKVYIIGADLGGTAGLKVAAREQIVAVAALSAGTNIRGLDVGADIPRITEPKLFIAAEGDGDFAQQAQSMHGSARDPKTIVKVPGTAHGSDLLKGSSADRTRTAIFEFLDKNK